MSVLAGDTAEQALFSAFLEKDFASLERDAFRNALLRNEETEKSYRSNIEDLGTSIDDTSAKLDEEEKAKADLVREKTRNYVETVDSVLKSGTIDSASVARMLAAGNEVDSNIEAIRDPVVARAAEIEKEQASIERTSIIVSLAIAFITCLLSYLLARAVRRSITQELEDLRSTIAQIESGRLDVDVPYLYRSDEVGELARAAERLRETTREKAATDAQTREMIARVGESLHSMAEGDLTVELCDLGDTYAKLRDDFNRTAQRLRNALLSVSRSTHSIRSGAMEINQASGDLAMRTERHANDLGQTAEQVRALSGELTSTAKGAEQAHKGVHDAVTEAHSGGRIVGEAVIAMESIEKSTAEISNIITVIDGIAFQTNLLALNAGVEAARAGDLGKGFAVVANEVRALAQRSAEAAKDVRELIETSSGQVAAGVEMVRNTGQALNRIIERISGATDLVTSIASSSSDQSERLRVTTDTIGSMDVVTQQNAAMVEESTAAARSLATEADVLADLVGKFRLGEGSVVSFDTRRMPPAQRMAPNAPRRSMAGAASAAPAMVEDADWSEF
jgi:Methyl-accepting chemotaxis protein